MFASRCGWWKPIERFAVLMSVLLVALGGCTPPSLEEPGEKPERSAAARTDEADDAVRRVLAGLHRGELEALWDFWPPSYRHDLQQLVRDIGQRLDEPSWQPFVTTAQKARSVASRLARQISKSSPTPDSERNLISQLNALEYLLGILCESELSDLSAWRTLDARQFLSGTGNKLLEAMSRGALGGAPFDGGVFSRLGEVRVELAESTGETAVLTLQWPGQEPTRHPFVSVEGHWIPQTLAAAWPTEFPKFREQCLAWADELRLQPQPWHARLREVDALLDELAATKSLAEARQVWQAEASRLIGAWWGASSRSEPVKSKPTPVEVPLSTKPARVKRPDTEVLLPDEPDK